MRRREAGAARAAAQRKLKAMRALGLAPPPGSPHALAPNLDVARAWLARALAEQQAAQQRALAAQQQQQHRLILQVPAPVP